MQSKRILVTGANGQLGSEMRKLGSVSPNEYIFTDVQELDITNKEAVMSFVEQNGVNIIVNCAAYTNVTRPRMMRLQQSLSTPPQLEILPRRQRPLMALSSTFRQIMSLAQTATHHARRICLQTHWACMAVPS